MTTASDHLDHTRRSTTQNARSAGLISGRRFCRTVASCCLRARFSRMSSRRQEPREECGDRRPEESKHGRDGGCRPRGKSSTILSATPFWRGTGPSPRSRRSSSAHPRTAAPPDRRRSGAGAATAARYPVLGPWVSGSASCRALRYAAGVRHWSPRWVASGAMCFTFREMMQSALNRFAHAAISASYLK